MLEDSRYKRIPNLEARVREVLEKLHALETDLFNAEGRRRDGRSL
jgi:hypothetical protein